MKHIFLLLSFLFILDACSSAPTRSPAAAVETKKYTQSMVAVQAEVASRASCPASVSTTAGWTTWAAAANACVKAGQWNKVEEYGNELSKREYYSPWGPYYLSLAATEKSDFLRATWMLDLAIKKAPGIGLFQYQKARLAYLNKDYPLAVEGFAKAAKMDPGLYPANLMLGQIFYRDQEWDKAVQQFKQVLEVEPQNKLALVSVGEIYVQKGDGKNAAEAYRQVVAAFPEEMDYRLRLAHVYEKMNNDVERAVSLYKETLLFIETKRIKTSNSGLVIERLKALELSNQKVEKKKPVAQTERQPASFKVQPGGKK